MYLLDTNVISELCKAKPHGAVIEWIKNIQDHQLFLSAMTLGEIQMGIEITRTQDSQKASEIEEWADNIAMTYNVLPLTTEILRLWAKLMHHQSDLLYEDALIAATAIRHNLIIVTRNERDFKRWKVSLLNPFK